MLSHSTRKIDQTLKRHAYQGLPSLVEYVLIEQEFVDVEEWRRANHWQSEHFYLVDEIYFVALDLRLRVKQIYAKVMNEHPRAFLTAGKK